MYPRLFVGCSYELLGETPKGRNKWRWDRDVAKTIGLVFSHMDNEDDEDMDP